MRRWLVRMLILTLLVASAPTVSADPSEAPPAFSEEEQMAYWQGRGRALAERVRDASARLAAGREEYQRIRHHRRIRGEDKVAVLTEIARAEADLIEAQAALERLPEEARRAGAPPGWLPEFEGAAPLEDFAEELAAEARTPEAHLALARSLRARAARYRSMAERHREMGLAYDGSRMRTIGEQRKHCDRLAELEIGVAEEYERLAQGHETQAEP